MVKYKMCIAIFHGNIEKQHELDWEDEEALAIFTYLNLRREQLNHIDKTRYLRQLKAMAFTTVSDLLEQDSKGTWVLKDRTKFNNLEDAAIKEYNQYWDQKGRPCHKLTMVDKNFALGKLAKFLDLSDSKAKTERDIEILEDEYADTQGREEDQE